MPCVRPWLIAPTCSHTNFYKLDYNIIFVIASINRIIVRCYSNSSREILEIKMRVVAASEEREGEGGERRACTLFLSCYDPFLLLYRLSLSLRVYPMMMLISRMLSEMFTRPSPLRSAHGSGNSPPEIIATTPWTSSTLMTPSLFRSPDWPAQVGAGAGVGVGVGSTTMSIPTMTFWAEAALRSQVDC